jgi:hypothetical protein
VRDSIVAILGTLVGVGLGSLMTHLLDISARRRDSTLETRLTLADTYDLIWGDPPMHRS